MIRALPMQSQLE